MDAKQTQPPARYSAGKLIQEMERLGLGTKATRHDIIQTLSDRKYVTGEPIEPTCKGITRGRRALAEYAERITTPEMTSELDAEMDAIAEGSDTRERGSSSTRASCSAASSDVLLDARRRGRRTSSRPRPTRTRKSGSAPVSGHDLLIKFSPKTKSYFVGCSGLSGVRSDLPAARSRRSSRRWTSLCPVCGSPQVKVIKFKTKPRDHVPESRLPHARRVPRSSSGACPQCGGHAAACATLRSGHATSAARTTTPNEHP